MRLVINLKSFLEMVSEKFLLTKRVVCGTLNHASFFIFPGASKECSLNKGGKDFLIAGPLFHIFSDVLSEAELFRWST